MFKNSEIFCNEYFPFDICFILVNCEWDVWSTWSLCSNRCGTGTKSKTRKIKNKAQNGGTICSEQDIMEKECIGEECEGEFT